MCQCWRTTLSYYSGISWMSSVNFISRIEFLSWLMIAWLLNMYNTLFLSSIIDRIVLCLQGFDQRWFFLMCPQMRRSLTSRNLESDHRQLKSHGKIVMKYMNIVTPKLLFFNCLLSLMSWWGMETILDWQISWCWLCWPWPLSQLEQRYSWLRYKCHRQEV